MKILLVTQYFWPESFIVNSLATELKEKGHEVVVLTGLPNYPKGELFDGYSLLTGPWSERHQEVEIIRVPLIPRGKGFFRLALNYASFALSGMFFSLFRLPKNIDVILCFGMSPITLCLPAVFARGLVKKPLVHWVQDLWPESIGAVGLKSSLLMGVIGRIVKFIYGRCDIIMTQSLAFEPSIRKWGGQAAKVRYVPNWADPFMESPVPEWVSALPPGFKIGFAGNVGRAQDMKTLVQSAEILRATGIKWIVAGDGSDKKWLEEEIAHRGLEDTVIPVGKKPYNDMSAFFDHCDVLYVSLRDDPIFAMTVPAKVQAYMSAGRPILASLNGEGARIIEEAGCGIACAAETPAAVAAAAVRLFEMSEEEKKQMGKHGREYFLSHFERSRVIARIDSILTEARYTP